MTFILRYEWTQTSHIAPISLSEVRSILYMSQTNLQWASGITELILTASFNLTEDITQLLLPTGPTPEGEV